jgi:hypothetical protein
MRSPNPQDMMNASFQAFWMMAEAQWVIALRLAGMAGFWPMSASEPSRMVSEKLAAGQASAIAAMKAGMAGGTPGDVALAAIKPLRRRTRANARRLTRAVGQAK